MIINSAIELKDVISWIIPIIIITIVFFLFQQHQLKIERQTIGRLLEQDIMNILRTKSAQVLLMDSSDKKIEAREFRFILDEIPRWDYEKDNQTAPIIGWQPPIFIIIEGQRHWLVRRNDSELQYLASQAFHEILLWFRRVAQAYKNKVLTSDDLINSWRFFLPFGVSGRLVYFSQYFQGEEEIQAIVYIVNETLRQCLVHQHRCPIVSFNGYVTEEDRQILTRESRDRRLHERLATFMSR
jgi:hypothetical protein